MRCRIRGLVQHQMFFHGGKEDQHMECVGLASQLKQEAEFLSAQLLERRSERPKAHATLHYIQESLELGEETCASVLVQREPIGGKAVLHVLIW